MVDLREKARETLDAQEIAREHLGTAAGAAGLLGLILGYAVAALVV